MHELMALGAPRGGGQRAAIDERDATNATFKESGLARAQRPVAGRRGGERVVIEVRHTTIVCDDPEQRVVPQAARLEVCHEAANLGVERAGHGAQRQPLRRAGDLGAVLHMLFLGRALEGYVDLLLRVVQEEWVRVGCRPHFRR